MQLPCSQIISSGHFHLPVRSAQGISRLKDTIYSTQNVFWATLDVRFECDTPGSCHTM